MILLHVVVKTSEIAEEIARALLKEKLIVSATIIPGTKSFYSSHEEGEIIQSEESLLFGKTKALFFDAIDKLIREKYPDNLPLIYSVPIVNMNWELTEKLNNNTYEI